MRYRYFVPDGGGTIEDAKLIVSWVTYHDFDDIEYAVDRAAEMHYEANHADWTSGTVRFAIVDENDVVKMFDVTIDWAPTFACSEVQ